MIVCLYVCLCIRLLHFETSCINTVIMGKFQQKLLVDFVFVGKLWLCKILSIWKFAKFLLSQYFLKLLIYITNKINFLVFMLSWIVYCLLAPTHSFNHSNCQLFCSIVAMALCFHYCLSCIEVFTRTFCLQIQRKDGSKTTRKRRRR